MHLMAFGEQSLSNQVSSCVLYSRFITFQGLSFLIEMGFQPHCKRLDLRDPSSYYLLHVPVGLCVRSPVSTLRLRNLC